MRPGLLLPPAHSWYPRGSPKAQIGLGPAVWGDPGLTKALTLPLQLRRRFGDVFSLQLAWTPVVVLNGLAAVREALVTCGEDTADRPPVPIYQVLGIGPRSQGKWRWAQRPHFRGPWVGGDRSPSWAERARGRGCETERPASGDSGPGNHLHWGGVSLGMRAGLVTSGRGHCPDPPGARWVRMAPFPAGIRCRRGGRRQRLCVGSV